MSFHRENIIWQSKDGTWNRGFYKVEERGNYDDPDYDPEWDVEYDTSELEWASTGHSSEQAAHDSWNGSNPGGHWTVTYQRSTATECAQLDEMVWRYRNPEEAIKKDQRALRAKVKKVMADNDLTVGSYVRVTTGLNPTIKHWSTGLVTEGTLAQEGNWLGIKDGSRMVKILNVSTGVVDKSISGISQANRPRASYSYRW